MTKNDIHYWHSMTTEEARNLAEKDPVVIFPLAAIEQHGPHLPLSTDLDIGIGLLINAFRYLPDDFPAWVLPSQSVGCSREHLRFPGTLNIDPELLSELVYQQIVAVAACGVRRIVFSNSHAGNRYVLDTLGLRLREELDLLVVKANYFQFPRPEGTNLPECEWRHGLHGGAVETSMMLHLRPELVRSTVIQDTKSLGEELDETLCHIEPEGKVSFSWLANDLHSSGVTGNVRLANAAIGKLMLASYGKVLSEVIQDAKMFPLDRLT